MLSSNQQVPFLSDDFLLKNKFSQQLYEDYAKSLPIIDYHNHLSPAEIASNLKFENITDLWLAGDHYKWRAMRTLGIDEQYITGNASAQEKFEKWAYTLPYTLRNPLFHWSALELKRYFGIEELLNPSNASQIYAETKATLQQESFRVRGLLQHMKVEVVGTTDDPTDTLEHHLAVHQEGASLQVYPTFRPDKAFGIEQPEQFRAYLQKLGLVVGFEINSFDTLIEALFNRIDYFHAHGCRVADHGLSRLYFSKNVGLSVDRILSNTLKGQLPSSDELEHFKFEVIFQLSKRYHAKEWVQQFHLGALRNTNERMLQKLGPDTGFDSIGDFDQASSLAAFFNELDKTDQLAKTVIYNLNPRDNEVFASMIGNYNRRSLGQKQGGFFAPSPYDAVGSLINIAAVGDGQNLNRAPATLARFGTIGKKNGTIAPKSCQTPAAAPSSTCPTPTAPWGDWFYTDDLWVNWRLIPICGRGNLRGVGGYR